MLHVLLRRSTGVTVLAAALLAGPAVAPAVGPDAHAAPTPSRSAAPAGSPVPRLTPAADAAAPDVCAPASAESPVVVDVTTLAPRAPTSPDEPFRVAGRLVNCGDEALSGLQVRLVTGGRLSSRSQLRRAAVEPVIGTRRLPAQDAQVTDLGAGASTRFDVRATVADLRLGGRNGVYPLAVQARARTGGGSRGPVGLASTFVPWFPEGPLAPTRLAWLLPFVDEPHRGPSGVLLSDRLEQLVAPSGRLSRALLGGRVGAAGACEEPALAPDAPDPPAATSACRGEPVPLTWAVDPDLVSGVEAMTRPYAVLVGGRRTDRPASDDAAAWLASLRAAADEADVLALPYADPDVVALSRTGSPLADDVALLQQLGQSEARRLLDAEPLATVAWPPPGPVTGVVDTLAGSERRALVVRASSIDGRDRATARTPGARTTLPSTVEPVPALVPDDALSDLVAPDPTEDGWQGERLAEQRWLVETAMVAAERPGESRTLVVAPDRRADLLPAVLAGAVADTGRLPWLCGVPLADAAAGTERCAQLPDAQPPAGAGPAVPATSVPDVQPLPPSFLGQVAAVRRDSDQFTEQVLAPDADGAKDLTTRLLRARGRAESTAWRTRPGAGSRVLDLLRDDVAALRSRVTLVGQPALLTGREGTVQLVVQNQLDQPVTVGVRLDPTSAARLTSEDAEIQVFPGNTSQQVSVRVEARTSGRFTARVGLVDASGSPFGDPVELSVRSTQYGRVALAVTGAAAAVLLVAAGVRITRRVRRPPPPAPVEPREPARPGSGV